VVVGNGGSPYRSAFGQGAETVPQASEEMEWTGFLDPWFDGIVDPV
jgi:hypothetical protein